MNIIKRLTIIRNKFIQYKINNSDNKSIFRFTKHEL